MLRAEVLLSGRRRPSPLPPRLVGPDLLYAYGSENDDELSLLITGQNITYTSEAETYLTSELGWTFSVSSVRILNTTNDTRVHVLATCRSYVSEANANAICRSVEYDITTLSAAPNVTGARHTEMNHECTMSTFCHGIIPFDWTGDGHVGCKRAMVRACAHAGGTVWDMRGHCAGHKQGLMCIHMTPHILTLS